ncbi:small ribosomal subunit mS33 [Hyphodiscus hymeniophilus]|uniref:Small ribosomal subunit protein mS33 n=1 Tax=Hyphodiscus hymeniophilus TaxID=353542 RepID=A0A9P7AVY7_9HELO|nr:small ribosomal subunit mS33 [Hyphodiscus hymeniophilus]
MSVPRSRILDLLKVQCRIFNHTFNPERLRTGNKILRQRLKGPALAAYYPQKMATIPDLQRAYAAEGLETINEPEDDRREHIRILKARGKGAPKKQRTPNESKKKKR